MAPFDQCFFVQSIPYSNVPMAFEGISRSSYGTIARCIEQGIAIDREAYSLPHSSKPIDRVTLEFSTPTSHQKQNISWIERFEKIILDARRLGIVENAIVHGSFGDLTTTFFSDLEVTLLISNKALVDQSCALALSRWIRKTLNPFILSVDPLQHHGAFYLWPDLLMAYTQDILPLVAYEQNWAVRGENIVFNIVRSEPGLPSKNLLTTVDAIRNYQTRFFKFGVNPYSIKQLLSNIMLIPAFFWQAQGIILSKKEAIHSMRLQEISDINKMLNRCSKMRACWPRPPKLMGRLRAMVNNGSIPSGRADIFIRGLYRNGKLEAQANEYLLPIIPAFCDAIDELNASYANR